MTIQFLPIEKVYPNPKQPRKVFKEDEETGKEKIIGHDTDL